MTDQVHPDVRDMAQKAAAAVGLDIAGIDYLTPDISRSYRDVGGAIREVNCRPSPSVHALADGDGLDRIISAYVDYIFPKDLETRISTIAVLGGKFGTACTYMIADILKESGRRTGVASAKEIYIDRNFTSNSDTPGGGAALSLLCHPKFDTAIFDLTISDVVEEGLATDSTTVSIVAEPLSDDSKARDKYENEIALVVHRLLVDVADSAVVLRADNPLCLEIFNADGSNGICIIAKSGENEVAQTFLSAGHAVVTKALLNGEVVIVVHAGGNSKVIIG